MYPTCRSRRPTRAPKARPWCSASFGRHEEPSAAKANDRAQDDPGRRLDQERHGRGGRDDHAAKSSVDADVAKSLDDPPAKERAGGEAGEIAAEHETGHGGIEALQHHAQAD